MERSVQQQQRQVPPDADVGPASENPIHQTVIKPHQNKRPPIKNNDLRTLVMCESCGSGLDYPFVHQRCQHVVCATCAEKRHDKLLCKACQASFQSQHAQYIGVLTVVPHNHRMADVVSAIAGRNWITWMRADLDEKNRAAFLEATAVRNEITRVSDPTYQALLATPTVAASATNSGPAGFGPQARANWNDEDMEDYIDYRRRARRCCGDGCCGSIFGCFADILCCCGLATCCGNMCKRSSRTLRNIVIGVFIFIFLGWLFTGINRLLTGNPTMENWIAKRPEHPLMQNIPINVVASFYEEHFPPQHQPQQQQQQQPRSPQGPSSIWRQRKDL
jgi:hypothetical protein